MESRTTGDVIAEALRANFAAQCDAMVLGDVVELDALLTDDFSLLHMTGYRQPKAEWLTDIDDDRMEYHHIDVVELQVTAEGNTPVLTVRTITEATIWGTYGTWHLQLRQSFQDRSGRWLAQRSVASTW